MGDEEWEEEDMKEFTRLVENYKKTWKPASEELEVINLGTEQKKKKRVEGWHSCYNRGKK
jgi:hypothetical protein